MAVTVHTRARGREPFVVAARLATNFIFCRCQARSPSLGSRLLVDGIRKSLRSPDSALWLHPERDGRLALAYRSGCSGVGFRGSAFGRRATPQERTANAPRRNGTSNEENGGGEVGEAKRSTTSTTVPRHKTSERNRREHDARGAAKTRGASQKTLTAGVRTARGRAPTPPITGDEAIYT